MVLTSSHEKVFSAGGNLDGFAADVPLVHKHFGIERFPRLFRLIGELGKPTICAANGHVLAGSLGLALACDLIVAKDSAGFGTPEINVGVFPFMIMALIYRNVPRKKTNEMLLLGERLTAAGGARGRDREQGRARRGVRRRGGASGPSKLAGKSPVMMRLGKDAMFRQMDMPFDDALEYLRHNLTLALSTEDVREGVEAFFEKREPRVEGPMSAALVALRCRTSDRTPAAGRGVDELAPLVAKRLGREARAIGEPGEPRATPLRGRPARRARLPARGGRPGGGRAGRRQRAGAAGGRVLDRAHHAARRWRASGPTRRCSGSTPTATSTRPTPPPAATSAAWRSPARPGAGTPGWPRARCRPTASCSPACATSTSPSARRSRASPVTVIGASPVETLVAVKNALDGAPVYIHLDLDVIDPEEFPAQFPAPGGLRRREALRPARGGGRRLRARGRRGHRLRGARGRARAPGRGVRSPLHVLEPLLDAIPEEANVSD